MSDIWTTFSHTHRGFDLSKSVSQSVIDHMLDLARQQPRLNLVYTQDPELIRWIYDQSSIPVVDKFRLGEVYCDRKNSQLLAPVLFSLAIERGDADSNDLHYQAGHILAHMALSAIKARYQTGFCICYENNSVESKLRELGILGENHGFASVPFLSVGLQQQGREWYWCSDRNADLKGPEKQDHSTYISVN